MTAILMHDIEVRDGSGEKLRTMRIKSEEHIVHEWTNSVVMLTHTSSSQRLAVVVLDAKNHKKVLVEVPHNKSYSNRASDFIMEIFGVNSNGKIVTCCTRSLDPNEQNETIDPVEGLNQLQLSRRHISKAKYEIRFSSSDGTKFIFLTESETDEKHFFQCASGTTKYEIPFPLKPTKEYEINVFRGECLDPGRFTLSEHGSLKFQAGITSNKINEIQIILQQ